VNPEEKKRKSALMQTGRHYLLREGAIRPEDSLTNVTEGVKGTPAEGKVFFSIKYYRAQDRATQPPTKAVTVEVLREHFKEHFKNIKDTDTNIIKPAIMGSVKPPETWSSERVRLAQYFKTHGPDSTNTSTWNTFNPMTQLLVKDNRLACRCPKSVRPGATTCDHIRWGYLFGIDAEMMRYRRTIETISTVSNYTGSLVVHLPIGMGFVWAKATLVLNPDKASIGIISELDTAICRILKYPTSSYVMGLDEGVLGYVQYLEDLIMQTDPYVSLVESADIKTITCSRKHGMAVNSNILAQIRPQNPSRNNWMIANAAMTHESNQKYCLGCASLSVGRDDVPNF
jgi:hypothetical protein